MQPPARTRDSDTLRSSDGAGAGVDAGIETGRDGGFDGDGVADVREHARSTHAITTPRRLMGRPTASPAGRFRGGTFIYPLTFGRITVPNGSPQGAFLPSVPTIPSSMRIARSFVRPCEMIENSAHAPS